MTGRAFLHVIHRHMRVSSGFSAILFACLLLLPYAGNGMAEPPGHPPSSEQAQAATHAAPCVKAIKACEQWITYGHYGEASARSMVYSTYPLDTHNARITRALIMVHGMMRNADHYFKTATAAAFLAGALEDTIVIAPHIIDHHNKPRANEVVWSEGRVNWRDGGKSINYPGLYSFDFVDTLVRMLANKKVFPNLEEIVIAGHSAGGQFVDRYAMSNKVDGSVRGVKLSYVVADPSTYAWPTADRPLPVGSANPVDAYKEAMDGTHANTDFKYAPYSLEKDPTYNFWPMGLDKRAGYTASQSDAQLRKQLVDRHITFLLGQVDVLPLGGFSTRPDAMAQGPTRRARGEAFVNYVNKKLGARHKLIIVSECAHNDRCIYTTRNVLPVIFPGRR